MIYLRSRSPVLSGIPLSWKSGILQRLAARIKFTLGREQSLLRKAVIVGINPLSCQLAIKLQENQKLKLNLLGFFAETPPTISGKSWMLKVLDWKQHNLVEQAGKGNSSSGTRILGTLKHLPEYVKKHGIQVVYLALAKQDQAAVQSLLEALKDTTACVYLVPNLAIPNLPQPKIYDFEGLAIVSAWEIPYSGLGYGLKRSLDILLSSLVLFFLAPLFQIIALGIKLSSPGPVLFKQRRHGMNGEQITIYKFRSMTVMENGGSITQATRNDVRVTRFGAFLRRTSLDELPQFINVLQGRMSIVGPRPHAIAHNEQYRKLIEGYMLRHKMKPGITGWAQIHGLRGETETLDKMQKRVEYDLYYLKHWSLGLDLQIILRTALVFFQTKGVY
jgi:putative colanic acid biosysnthesis UDP-glucose lipid carrier transferase